MRVKRGLGRALAAVSILLVVTASATAYSYYLFQQQSTQVSQLQHLVSNLESRNTQLQQELNSGVTPNNASVLSLDPVSIYRSANRSIVTIQGVQVTTVNTFFGPQQSLQVVLGSGFVIQDTGSYYIVTNFHVLSGDTNLTVTFWRSEEHTSELQSLAYL